MSQARVRGREMQAGFWWENVKVRDHLENPWRRLEEVPEV